MNGGRNTAIFPEGPRKKVREKHHRIVIKTQCYTDCHGKNAVKIVCSMDPHRNRLFPPQNILTISKEW